MKPSTIFQIGIVLVLITVFVFLETILCDGYNKPSHPFQATPCLIGMILLPLVFFVVIRALFKGKQKKGSTNDQS